MIPFNGTLASSNPPRVFALSLLRNVVEAFLERLEGWQQK
jgi:hypothetical protein